MVGVGDLQLDFTPHALVNDALMAIFLFTVGLEVRREFAIGELTSWFRAMVPVAAAIAGLVLPALLFILVARSSGNEHAWGVVISADTAFLVGAVALIGPTDGGPGSWSRDDPPRRADPVRRLNWIEFTALRYFTLDDNDHASHAAQETAIGRYIRSSNRREPQTALRRQNPRSADPITYPTLRDAASAVVITSDDVIAGLRIAPLPRIVGSAVHALEPGLVDA